MTLAGMASPEATKHYADRLWQKNPKLSPNSWRVIEGLTVGKVGFGSYRIGYETMHSNALRAALLGGMNLIDTASNYMNGESERTIGRMLGTLVQNGELSRDEVVLMSKGGYLQGDMLAQIEKNPPSETIMLGDHAWHTLNPVLIQQQFEASLGRLGVDALDGYLLHNPEYHLISALMQNESLLTQDMEIQFYHQLEQAFVLLESLVQKGKLQFYGLSSNTLAVRDDTRLDLQKIQHAATRAAQTAWGRKKRAAFRIIELPVNLLELDAVKTANQTAKTFEGDEQVPALELASRMHLSVLANRPLNAFPVRGGMYRLADGGTSGNMTLDAARDALLKVEKNVTKVLGGWPQMDEIAVFQFTDEVEKIEDYVTSSIAYDHLYMTCLMPAISHMHQALGALKNQEGQRFEALDILEKSYGKSVQDYVVSLRQIARERDAAAIKPFEMELRNRLPEVWRSASLQQVAVNSIASIPGVSVVLCGARQPAYVQQALHLYEKGDFVDVAPILGASHIP